jgi:hypothetical protein
MLRERLLVRGLQARGVADARACKALTSPGQRLQTRKVMCLRKPGGRGGPVALDACFSCPMFPRDPRELACCAIRRAHPAYDSNARRPTPATCNLCSCIQPRSKVAAGDTLQRQTETSAVEGCPRMGGKEQGREESGGGGGVSHRRMLSSLPACGVLRYFCTAWPAPEEAE